MSTPSGTSSAPSERNRKLSRMIRREVESLKLTKEIYDSGDPKRAKHLSPDELWLIARTKVLRKLCEPENEAGSE